MNYGKVEHDVYVQANQSNKFNVTVSERNTALQQVEITGRRETDYKSEVSFIGTKTATPLIKVPQSVAVITKEVMQDQQVYRVGDVVRNVSGVNQFSSYNDFNLRGFRGDANFVNGLRAPFNFFVMPITPHYERIEILKGPSSVLFGNAIPGGIVNMVTKKPLEETRRSVDFTVGSFNTIRANGDFTGPLNEKGNVLYRLNVGYENAETFRDDIGNEALVVVPSVSFIPSEKTRINIELVYSTINTKLDRGLPVRGTDIYDLPTSFSLSIPSDHYNDQNISLTASLNHKFSDFLSFNTSFMKFFNREDLAEHRTSNRYVDGEAQTIMEMRYGERVSETRTNFVTNYFVGSFTTGAIKHETVVGLDFGDLSSDSRGFNSLKKDGVKDFYLFEPKSAYIADVASYGRTYFNFGANPTNNSFYGVYVQEQMNILDKLNILLSLRYDEYTDDNLEDNKVTKAWLPRVGLVYSILDNLNAYASYTEGFQPQSRNIARFGGPFDPEKSDQYEVGLKGSFFGGRLMPTLAVYQLTKNNILQSANNPDNPDLLRQVGQQRSKGIEVDVVGNVTPDLSVIANFALNETITTKDNIETNIGKIAPNAPQRMGGLWAKYIIPAGLIKGVGVGFGVNYVGERNTFNNNLQIPEYTAFNAALYYTIDKISISVNANNLADKTYFVGGYDYNRIFPAAPRNFLARVGYSF
jgi:iron complex outermembrane receptor protein